MRLTVGDGNPLSRRALILLNGVRVNKCVCADEDAGFVDFFPTPIEVRYSAPSTLVLHRLFGQVRIVDPQDAEHVKEAYTRCDRG